MFAKNATFALTICWWSTEGLPWERRSWRKDSTPGIPSVAALHGARRRNRGVDVGLHHGGWRVPARDGAGGTGDGTAHPGRLTDTAADRRARGRLGDPGGAASRSGSEDVRARFFEGVEVRRISPESDTPRITVSRHQAPGVPHLANRAGGYPAAEGPSQTTPRPHQGVHLSSARVRPEPATAGWRRRRQG